MRKTVVTCGALTALSLHCEPHGHSSPPPPGATTPNALIAPPSALPPKPVSSVTLAIERSLQASALSLSLQGATEPRVALGKRFVARLTAHNLSVHSLQDATSVLALPLEAPRTVVTMADGSFVAFGAKTVLRVEPGKTPSLFARPMFLPGALLFADSVQLDRIWIFDGLGQTAAKLSSYRLAVTPGAVLLPEQTLAFEGPSRGVLGVSREGVWLYWSAGQIQRYGPGGARLGRVSAPTPSGASVLLPSRRLDQATLLDGTGAATRLLISPRFRKLSHVDLGLTPLTAAVGDEGRLLAIVTIAGSGPRFELRLFDDQLQPLGRVSLPFDEPTGRDDWVQAVTRNLNLTVAAREPLVAVGGPERLLVFNARGEQVLSFGSK